MDKKLSTTLSENATLVRVALGHPSGIKTDKSLKNDLAEDVKSNADLLNVSKHIFGRNVNKEFRSIINAFRNDFYYPLTLPWSDTSDDNGVKVGGGWRLCPNSQLEKLQYEVNQAKVIWDREVEGFFKQLPLDIANAKDRLGDAFDEDDYPTDDWDLQRLRDKFIFQFEMSPLPTFGSDIRLNVSDELRKRIESDAVNRASSNIKNILVTTVDALVSQVDHLAEKLKAYDPENKQKGFFNNSSIEKLRQAVETLPSINSDILGNDQAISDAHQQLVSVLASINSVESLRDDTELGESKRKQVAEGLEQSVDGLKGGFLERAFGGKKND
jgi:hypothetical protein|tara:strand:+ start:1 stop:984 length:984 start_codon:yes stop_codon:yes gene_type:complete